MLEHSTKKIIHKKSHFSIMNVLIFYPNTFEIGINIERKILKSVWEKFFYKKWSKDFLRCPFVFYLFIIYFLLFLSSICFSLFVLYYGWKRNGRIKKGTAAKRLRAKIYLSEGIYFRVVDSARRHLRGSELQVLHKGWPSLTPVVGSGLKYDYLTIL